MSVVSNRQAVAPLTTILLWVMALATALIVANIYYIQPLLNDVAQTFRLTKGAAGQIAMYTQIGYATGLLFIIPLADKVKRKRLILIDFIFIIGALLLAACAQSALILSIASFFIGVSSVIPQVLIPMVAHLSRPEERGKKIGFVVSGLLLGILLSRTVSGVVGEYLGWRAMFYIAAGLMVLMWVLIAFMLPEVEPDYKGSYKQLMQSITDIVKQEPSLRLAALRGALCFGAFSAFWTTLVFLLLEPPFSQGSAVAGAFGLIGAVGAVAASLVGRLSDRMNKHKIITVTLLLVVTSFIIFGFSGHSIVGLILGVVLMDLGVQATHITNQSIIFSLNPEARNRINTVYMVSYFAGGSAGTFIASHVWSSYHWLGVCAVGVLLSAAALTVHLFFTYRKSQF